VSAATVARVFELREHLFVGSERVRGSPRAKQNSEIPSRQRPYYCRDSGRERMADVPMVPIVVCQLRTNNLDKVQTRTTTSHGCGVTAGHSDIWLRQTGTGQSRVS
jgi:hypothetical protein